MAKLNAVQRLDLEQELMGLIAECLLRQHPHRERMAHVTLAQASALSDERLLALNERLTAWVAEQKGAQPVLSAPAEVG